MAGALERRVWISTSASDLYPNLFVLFVAPPGVGKDQALTPMRDLWASVGKLHIAPASMTHKGMIDMLATTDAYKKYTVPGTEEIVNFSSILVAAPEFGVLLPSNDPGMLSALCTLYDCGEVYEERTRGGGEVLHIERPHIHLVAGTQPKFLSNLLPDDAFQQGITSRMIMIYAGSPVKRSLFGSTTARSPQHKEKLLADLKQIASLAGPFVLDDEAMTAIDAWHMHGSDEDKPNHSKLQHYGARRIMHVLKLTMVYSAARCNTKVITKEDFENALELLLEAEELMPEIFKEMTSGSQASVLEEAFHFLMRQHVKYGKHVEEHRLHNFLAARVPTYQITTVMDAMISGRLMEEATMKGTPLGSRMFKPLALNMVE